MAGDWQLKVYSVVLAGSAPDWGVFEPALSLALDTLPLARKGARATRTRLPDRAHGARHLVHRAVLVGPGERAPDSGLGRGKNRWSLRWRAARDSESVCVWDLDIIWHERQAWVRTMLSGEDAVRAEQDYLDDVLERVPEPR